MRRSAAQLQLIERDPEPQKAEVRVTAEPSAPQLKALQQMRAGATLIYRTRPLRSVHLQLGEEYLWADIHPSTARVLVAYGWVTLINFSITGGEYRLHHSARAFTDKLCEHQHVHDDLKQVLDGRWLCRKCWRVVKVGV